MSNTFDRALRSIEQDKEIEAKDVEIARLTERVKELEGELNEWQKQVCGQAEVIFLLRERLHKFESDMMPFEYNKGGGK